MSDSKVNQSNSESMLNRLRDAEIKMRELLHNSNEIMNKVTDSTNLSMSKAQYDEESFNGDRFYVAEARFKQTLSNLNMANNRLNRQVGNVSHRVSSGTKTEELLVNAN